MRKRLTISIAFLIAGILVYYLYRLQLLLKENSISAFIRNYIPDGLWMISFYLIVANFMRNITKNYLVLSAFYTFLIGVIFEICQLNGTIHGTFDYWDIIIYFYSTLIACFIEKNCRRDNYEKS